MSRTQPNSVLSGYSKRTIAKLANGALLAFALVVLLGWSLKISALTTVLPGTSPMYPITALTLLLCGFAWLLMDGGAHTWRTMLAGVLAVVVLMTGVAAICEYLFDVNLGIDQALFQQTLKHMAAVNAGRIAPNTAIDFVLLGAALLLLIGGDSRACRIARVLVVMAAVIALFGLFGYAYFEPHLYRISHFKAMAFPTSVAILLLSTVLLASSAAPRQASAIWLGVVFLTAIVSINSLTAFLATRKLIEKNEWVEHTQVVSGELHATLEDLLKMEAGERGYLYTGEQQYLAPFHLGKTELESHLNGLTNLIADNPIQQQNLERLRVAVQDAASLFEQAIAFEAVGEHVAAKQLVLTGAGKTRMDAVEAVLNRMNAEEASLLVVRSAEAKRSAHYLLLTIPVTFIFTAVLLVLAGLLVSRDLRERVETAERFRELAERKHAAMQGLKKAQDALVRAEKLAAVGRMASTVAHEINNPLEAVTNLIWLAKNDPLASENVKKRLGMADEELRRVAHITRQTLGFYRDASQEKEVQMREVMDSVLGLYASRLDSKQISVRTKYEDCHVFGYAGELRQLFSNLCANAIDAIQTHGTLSVRASHSYDWKGSSEQGVRITIADDGCGIDPENLNSLFEPFFTTKETTGTGLGLWVTKQIVEKHGGRITVRSRTDLGRHYTVFSVFLPVRNTGRAQEFAMAS